MGWAKFDDRYATHPKLVAAGLEARGLDAAAVCYSAGQETDGFVDEAMLPVLAAGARSPAKVAQCLVEVERWHRADGKTAPRCACLEGLDVDLKRKGWWIHDFLEYNQSRTQATAQREAEREKKAKWRAKAGRSGEGRFVHRGQTRGQDGGQTGDAGDVSTGDNPVRPGGSPPVPDPTRPEYPSPTSPVGPDGGPLGAAVPAAEMEIDQDQPPTPLTSANGSEPPDPLLARMRQVWPRRPHRDRCAVVLSDLRKWWDDPLIDEAIGHALAMQPPPSSPSYVAKLVVDWARQRGETRPEAFAAFGGTP